MIRPLVEPKKMGLFLKGITYEFLSTVWVIVLISKLQINGIIEINHKLQMKLIQRVVFCSSKISNGVSKGSIKRGKYLEGKWKAVGDWQAKLTGGCKARAASFKSGLSKDTGAVASVEALKTYIRENPVAKMYLQGGLDQIPEWVHEYYEDEVDATLVQRPRKGVSYGYTWEQLLDQWAEITRTPPAFSDYAIIGVPFYAVVIDLLNTDFGRTFFAIDKVNELIKPIYNDYAAMLDTSASLQHMNSQPDGWLCPAARARVNYDDFVHNPKHATLGYKSWHEWFDREIVEEARPFDPAATHEILNNSEHYPNFQMPKYNVKWNDNFWLKDQRYSIAEMLGVDQLPASEQNWYKDKFDGGTIYQGFLNPWCYHRWRSPISGTVRKCYKVGNSYYAGNPSLSYTLAESYIASQPLLTMTSVRQVYIIEADNKNIGHLCVIEVGMAEVSGIVNNITEGQRVEKGQLLGMFRFGGSSHAFIFDKNIKGLEFNDSIYQRVENTTTGVNESVLQKVRTPLAFVSKAK